MQHLLSAHLFSSSYYAVGRKGNVTEHSEEHCVSQDDETVCNHQKKKKKQFTKTKQSHVHFSWPLEICVIVRQTHCISQSQDGIGNSFNMQGVMFNSVLLPFLHVSCHDV